MDPVDEDLKDGEGVLDGWQDFCDDYDPRVDVLPDSTDPDWDADAYNDSCNASPLRSRRGACAQAQR